MIIALAFEYACAFGYAMIGHDSLYLRKAGDYFSWCTKNQKKQIKDYLAPGKI